LYSIHILEANESSAPISVASGNHVENKGLGTGPISLRFQYNSHLINAWLHYYDFVYELAIRLAGDHESVVVIQFEGYSNICQIITSVVVVVVAHSPSCTRLGIEELGDLLGL